MCTHFAPGSRVLKLSFDRCHLIIVLARGKLMYYGPPSEAQAYFGVPKISAIYDKLQDQAETKKLLDALAQTSSRRTATTAGSPTSSPPAKPPCSHGC